MELASLSSHSGLFSRLLSGFLQASLGSALDSSVTQRTAVRWEQAVLPNGGPSSPHLSKTTLQYMAWTRMRFYNCLFRFCSLNQLRWSDGVHGHQRTFTFFYSEQMADATPARTGFLGVLDTMIKNGIMDEQCVYNKGGLDERLLHIAPAQECTLAASCPSASPSSA